jgi:hypothetical protein
VVLACESQESSSEAGRWRDLVIVMVLGKLCQVPLLKTAFCIFAFACLLAFTLDVSDYFV